MIMMMMMMRMMMMVMVMVMVMMMMVDYDDAIADERLSRRLQVRMKIVTLCLC